MQLSALGPRPPGDPDAMRSLAQTLRGLAAPLAGVGRVDLDNWESPRGREVKARIQDGADTAAREADQLVQLADELSRAADRLADAQLDWAVRYSEHINRDSSIPRGKI